MKQWYLVSTGHLATLVRAHDDERALRKGRAAIGVDARYSVMVIDRGDVFRLPDRAS